MLPFYKEFTKQTVLMRYNFVIQTLIGRAPHLGNTVFLIANSKVNYVTRLMLTLYEEFTKQPVLMRQFSSQTLIF